jgi:nucleotide-binding universal stress UspA family protein
VEAPPARILVVANRTAESPELLHVLRERSAEGPADFTLLVPTSAHGMTWATDMHAGGPEAEEHLEAALSAMREAGLTVEGRLGDPDPIAAVQDAVNFGSYDEVIVSTLPHGISRWLGLDLPRRVERSTGLPVRHVIASAKGGRWTSRSTHSIR